MKTLHNLFFALAVAICAPAWAWPDRPVKIIISLPVGSGPDVQLRHAAKVLTGIWQQPVVVENRPGGSGIIAINQLVKEAVDGHTIGLFSMGDIVASPLLYGLGTPLAQIEPVAPFITADMVLFSSPQITSTTDLGREIARNPLYGSWAVGSVGHVAAAEFASVYTANARHVPYKEYGPWYIDTANRTLAFGFTSFGSGHAMHSAGRIRYHAVAAARRDPRFPDLPTVKEATGRDIQAQSWLAFYADSRMPDAIKQRIGRDIRQAMALPEVKNYITANFFIPLDRMNLLEFRQQVEQDHRTYQRLLQKYNINIAQ